MTLPFREWTRFYQATLEADRAMWWDVPFLWKDKINSQRR